MRLMYWKQPAPTGNQSKASGLVLEKAPSSTGPWASVPYTATIKSDNYWCANRGDTTPGDCFLVQFDDTGATYVRAQAIAVVDGKNLASDYSAPVALPEPELSVMLMLGVLFLTLRRSDGLL